MRNKFFAAAMAAIPVLAAAVEVTSPDGNIKVTVDVPAGVPTYSMTFGDKKRCEAFEIRH